MEIGNILELTVNLASQHLSQAAFLLREARKLTSTQPHPWSYQIAGRQAVSCILHSYCGLEAALNSIGYNLFSNAKSARYIPPNKRDLALQRLIKAWENNLPATDKMRYILATTEKALPPKLENELRELNILRNWIAHGFTFTRLVLVEKQPDGTYRGVDEEEGVDWQMKFPNTQFEALDRLGDRDACTALRIVLDCIKELDTRDADTLFWMCPFWSGPDYKVITRDFDVPEFIKASAP